MPESSLQPRPRGRPKSFHDKSAQNVVQSLDKAMDLLAILGDAAGLTQAELANRTGLSPATVYRVLMTLQAHGMVEIEEPGQLWHVGAGTFRIGSAFLRRTKVAERARGHMQALMRATGETANLGVESGDEVLFLAQVEAHEAIRAFFPPGTLSPMHVSGIGKALLAWFPEDRVRGIVAHRGLARFTAHSLVTEEALMRDLALVRARGYAVDDQEKAEGMRCVAAPVFNAYGEPVAGVSVSGPAFRMPLDEAGRIGALVAETAGKVTEAIAGVRP